MCFFSLCVQTDWILTVCFLLIDEHKTEKKKKMSVFSNQAVRCILPLLDSKDDIVRLAQIAPIARDLLITHADVDRDTSLTIPELMEMIQFKMAVLAAVGFTCILENNGEVSEDEGESEGEVKGKELNNDEWVEQVYKMFNTFRLFGQIEPMSLLTILQKIIDHHECTLPRLMDYLTTFPHWTCIGGPVLPVKFRCLHIIPYAINRGLPAEYLKVMVDSCGSDITRTFNYIRQSIDLTKKPIPTEYIDVFPPQIQTLLFGHVARHHGMEYTQKLFHRVRDYFTDYSYALFLLANAGVDDVEMYEFVFSQMTTTMVPNPWFLDVIARSVMAMKQHSQPIFELLLRHKCWSASSIQYMYLSCFEGYGDVDLLKQIYDTGVEFRRVEGGRDAIDIALHKSLFVNRDTMEPIFQFVIDHFKFKENETYISDLVERIDRRNDWHRIRFSIVWAVQMLLERGATPNGNNYDSVPYKMYTLVRHDNEEMLHLLLEHGGSINVNGGAVRMVAMYKDDINRMIRFFERYEDQIDWKQVRRDGANGQRIGTIFSSLITECTPETMLKFLVRFPQAMVTAGVPIYTHNEAPMLLWFMAAFKPGPTPEAISTLDKMLGPDVDCDVVDINASAFTGGSGFYTTSLVMELIRWRVLDRYPHLHSKIDWLRRDHENLTIAARLMVILGSNQDFGMLMRVIQAQVDAGWDINETTKLTHDHHTFAFTLARTELPQGFLAEILTRFPQIDMHVQNPLKDHAGSPLAFAIYIGNLNKRTEHFIRELIESGRIDMTQPVAERHEATPLEYANRSRRIRTVILAAQENINKRAND